MGCCIITLQLLGRAARDATGSSRRILFRELRPLTHQLLPGRAATTSPGARGEAPQGRVVALEINISSLCVDMFDTTWCMVY